MKDEQTQVAITHDPGDRYDEQYRQWLLDEAKGKDASQAVNDLIDTVISIARISAEQSNDIQRLTLFKRSAELYVAALQRGTSEEQWQLAQNYIAARNMFERNANNETN